jgi:hypothetical protein
MTAPREPGDTPMTGRYVAALVLEAVIVLLLYLLGRVYR